MHTDTQPDIRLHSKEDVDQPAFNMSTTDVILGVPTPLASGVYRRISNEEYIGPCIEVAAYLGKMGYISELRG